MSRKLFPALVAATLVALTLTGCTSGASGPSSGAAKATGGKTLNGDMTSAELRDHAIKSLKGKTVGWVPVGLGRAILVEQTRRMKRGFEAAGMKFIVRDPNWDSAKSAVAAQSLVDQHVDVLVVVNLDVHILANILKKAEQQGIYVIQLNMDSNYKTDAFIGADPIALGERIANRMADVCGQSSGKSGEIAIVQGDATSGFTLAMMEGAKKVFDQHKDIKVVSTQVGGWDRTKSYDITANVIQQHPNLCADWGFDDEMMYGAATAIKAAGKIDQVKAFTSDSSRIACEALRDGIFFESVGWDVPVMGDDAVAIAKQLLQAGQAPGTSRIADFSRLFTLDRNNWNSPGACYDGKTDVSTVR